MMLELIEQHERRWRPLQDRLRFEQAVLGRHRAFMDSPLFWLLPGAHFSSEPAASAPEADPTQALARELALRIRGGSPVRQLAREYRTRLEQLGLVRADSQSATALRRLQAFLARHVYGVLIPEDQLPSRIRVGRASGALRP